MLSDVTWVVVLHPMMLPMVKHMVMVMRHPVVPPDVCAKVCAEVCTEVPAEVAEQTPNSLTRQRHQLRCAVCRQPRLAAKCCDRAWKSSHEFAADEL